MTRSLFTMKVETVIVIIHSIALIYADPIEDPTENLPKFHKDCKPKDDVILYHKSQNIFIPCQAEGDNSENLKFNYWWTKDGKKISANNTKNEQEKDCQWGLLLKASNNANSDGSYQCFISNSNGRGIAMSNRTIYREIAPFPVFETKHQKISATEGSSLKLNCTAPSNAAIMERNTWTSIAAGESIANHSRITQDEQGNLWFSNVQSSDKGTYIYTVSMPSADFKFCQTDLEVVSLPEGKNPPHIEVQALSVSSEIEFAELGKKKQLFCIYDGMCDIKWKKDGKILNSGGNIMIGKSKKFIEINNFGIEDEGNYTCEVTENGHNEIKESLHFIVKIGKPFIKNSCLPSQSIEGHRVDFHCEAYGYDDTNRKLPIQWLYNTEPINENTTFFHDLIISRDTVNLTITKSHSTHIGIYGCKVENKHGYVFVESPLSVAPKQACHSINQSLENKIIIIEEGAPINWTCPAKGFPHPKITWTKNTESLENGTDGRIIISSENYIETIMINNTNFNDAGEYACIAECEGEKNLTIKFFLKPPQHAEPETSNPSLRIIIWVIIIIIIALILLAIALICKKRGYAHRIYDLRKRERQAERQQEPRTPEQSEVSLLAGGSARTATLNLKRKNTQNGISLAEVECRA